METNTFSCYGNKYISMFLKYVDSYGRETNKLSYSSNKYI
jgi:hypothetical protein